MKSSAIVSFLLGSISLTSSISFSQYRKVSERRDEDGCIYNDSRAKYRITPRIIRQYGYPVECHFVTTEDGYILGMHRIPHGKNREADSQKMPVLLQHGLIGSSADWLLAGPNISVGFLLVDQGYDVWLGNTRGNTYSRKHIKLSTRRLKFWNFSFHEMGIYDVPAEIDYILQHTSNTQLKYIGHSMGNTMFYVMGSMRPEYNKKISGQISFSPVAYMTHSTSVPLRALAPISPIIKKFVDVHFHGEMFSRGKLLNAGLRAICAQTNKGKMFCKEIFSFIFGRNPAQLPTSLIPVLFEETPAGESSKTFAHYGQVINSGRFCQYDYGRTRNLLRYNSEVPPAYNISAISAKVVAIYGRNDPITNERDVARFYTQLPNPGGLFTPSDPAFTHFDFLLANEVRSLLSEDVFEILNSFDNNSEAPRVKQLIPVDPKSLQQNYKTIHVPR